MRKMQSIGAKITRTIFIVSMIALLTLGVASMANIYAMRNAVVTADRALGQTAADDSASALEQETRAKMLTISSYLGQLADQKLSAISDFASILAHIATDIFSHPDAYTPMAIVPPLAENAGKVTLYYTKPLSVDAAQVEGEARLAANAGTYMKHMLAADDAVLTCYISFLDGLHVICDKDSGLRTSPQYDYDPTTRGWFRRAQSEQTVGFTDITVDAQGRGLGVVCSAPFYGADGALRGVVGIGALIDEVKELILTADMGTTGGAFVLNRDGAMIIGDEVALNRDGVSFVRPDVANSSSALAALELVSGNTGVAYVPYHDENVYMAWYPIPTTGWTLVVYMGADEALALSRQTSEKIDTLTRESTSRIDHSIILSVVIIFAVMLVTGCAVTLVGRKRARSLTDPIHTLTEGVGVISGGNLDVSLDIHTGDEIETLSDAFTSMTGQLKDYIENLTAVTAEKERIGAELNVATTIQASMLPCIFPAFPERPEIDIFASMTPAKEVGGDFYDFFFTDPDHLAVVIADVSGKGVPAALFMVIAKTLIKNYTQLGHAPADVFTAVNAQLCENNEAGMFVTGWMGLLELSTGKFVYVNAGHNPPLLKRAGGTYEFLRSRAGFVLAGMNGIRYRSAEIVLQNGDSLFLYTDGVTEATDAACALYGEPRLQAALNARLNVQPEQLLHDIKADIDCFVGAAPQFDDITMLNLLVQDVGGGERSLTLDADKERLTDALSFVEKEMERREFPMKAMTQVSVAVEELFVNVASYAYPDGGGSIELRTRWQDAAQTLYVMLIDSGRPYNPLEHEDPDITLTAEERDIGGLGILMTKKTMDDVQYQYEHGRNCLTIAKKRGN